MAGTDWNEVGERFNHLGRAVQDRWSRTRAAAPYTAAQTAEATDDSADRASAEVRSAMDRVTASLDDLADAITRTANDPGIRDAATSAASGLIDALGASLEQLAGRMQSGGRRDEQAPGTDPSGRDRTDT